MDFYTSKLSERMEVTPEGYLLCRDVPVGRAGEQLYLPEEVGLEAGSDGIVRVERPESEVFDDESLASLNAKPFTFGHPAENVTPENWSIFAKGFVLNPRRGEGDEDHLLLADILITDASTIVAVQSGRRELSCGYNCRYIQTSEGQGEQQNIRFNHVALVESGRAGGECRISDHAPRVLPVRTMMMSLKDRILAAFTKTLDSAMKDEAIPEDEEKKEEPVAAQDAEAEGEPEKKDEVESKDEEPSLSDLVKRIDALEAKLASLTTNDDEPEAIEEKKEEEETKTGDSADLVADLLDSRCRAEILAPGIDLPTHDAASDTEHVRNTVTALKRKALTIALNGKFADAIRPLVNETSVATMDGQILHTAFIGASEIVKRENNDLRIADAAAVHDIHSIQQQITNFWASKGPIN